MDKFTNCFKLEHKAVVPGITAFMVEVTFMANKDYPGLEIMTLSISNGGKRCTYGAGSSWSGVSVPSA